MILQFATALVLPLLLCLLMTPVVIRLAHKMGATDTPGGRKIHKSVTPRIGGLAIFASICLSIPLLFLLFPDLSTDIREESLSRSIFVVSLFGIFFLGFVDDLKPLTPGIKFGVQFIIAALIYFAGFKISNVTNPLGNGMINVEMLDLPLTLLWIVGITNAFNLIDGLDGLASGVAAIAALSIGMVSFFAGEIWMTLFALILTGALLGFLKYNFNPATIFLGDSGSLLLGFCLALMSMQSTTKISTGFALLFPMLVLILPITDTLVSMARRFLGSFLKDRKEEHEDSFFHRAYNMFTPDTSHIHHQLLSLGLSHRNTVLVLYIVSAFFAAGAFILTRINQPQISLIVLLLFGYVLLAGIKRLRYYEIAIFDNGLMLPFYEKWILNRTIYLSLIDLSFITLAFSLSYYLTGGPMLELTYPESSQLFILLIAAQLSVFWISGLYRKKIKSFGIGNALRVAGSVIYAVAAAAVILVLLNTFAPATTLQFLVFDFYFLLSFTLGVRIAWHALSYWFQRGKRTGESMLIYGANENGTMILHKINHSSDEDIKIVGFLDDDPELEGKYIYGYPVFGSHWKLPATLMNHHVDSILICVKNLKPENFRRMKRVAEERGVSVKYLEVKLRNVKPDTLPEQNRSGPLLTEKEIKKFTVEP